MYNKVNSKTISVYQNLPSGGAIELYKLTLKFLKENFLINEFSEANLNKIARSNILTYLFTIYFLLKYITIRQINEINKSKLLIVFHSWILKSPFVLRYSNIPTIYICHEPPREFYDCSYIKSFSNYEKLINFIRLPIKLIDSSNVKKCKNLTIVANSFFSAKMIKNAYGIKPYVIYPGIDRSLFNKNPDYTQRKRQILCVGAINKLKNQQFILECMSLIPRQDRPALILIGNDKDKNYINQLIRYANKKSIDLHILLNVPKKQLVRKYQESILFCYSPINEPFGLVILEALSSGLPIITSTGRGGFNEVINSNNGYISNKLKRIEWANAITELIQNKEKWNKISKRNFIYSRKFSSSNMNKELNKLITEKINQ